MNVRGEDIAGKYLQGGWSSMTCAQSGLERICSKDCVGRGHVFREWSGVGHDIYRNVVV